MNSRSDQGEFRIKAAITKKKKMILFTFKKAHDLLHQPILIILILFQTNKVKFIPEKKVIRFTNIVIADVPTPYNYPLFSPECRDQYIRNHIT
jgi:hypothetical protein